MTNAIKTLENEISYISRRIVESCNNDCFNCDLALEDTDIIKGYEKAIKALWKQIPQKVNINGFFYANCLNCDKELYHKYKFCHDCGQALDWPEVE